MSEFQYPPEAVRNGKEAVKPEPLFEPEPLVEPYPTAWQDREALVPHLPKGVTLPKKKRPGGHPTIDWQLVALMLAHGRSAFETAQAVGVSRTTLWRAIKHSHGLHDMIQRTRAEIAAQSGARVEALREKVAATLEEKLAEGDTRVLLWLAKQLGVVQTDYHIYYQAGRMGPAHSSPGDSVLTEITAKALQEPARAGHKTAFRIARNSLPNDELEEIGYPSPPEPEVAPAKPRKNPHTPEQQAWVDAMLEMDDLTRKARDLAAAAESAAKDGQVAPAGADPLSPRGEGEGVAALPVSHQTSPLTLPPPHGRGFQDETAKVVPLVSTSNKFKQKQGANVKQGCFTGNGAVSADTPPAPDEDKKGTPTAGQPKSGREMGAGPAQ